MASTSEYWILDRDHEIMPPDMLRRELEKQHYFFRTLASTARLHYLYTRALRGLISYDQFDVPQLQQLCAKRKLLIPPWTGRATKTRLGELLEAADEDAGIFTWFMLLPPELRVQVYDLHIAWLRTQLDLHEDRRSLQWRQIPAEDRAYTMVPAPPLACVSRQIRAEVLPQFYGTLRLKLHIAICDFPTSTPDYLSFPHLHVIKRLRIIACYWDYMRRRWERDSRDIDLHTGKIDHRDKDWNGGTLVTLARHLAEARVSAVLRRMVDAAGEHGTTREHLRRLLKAYRRR